MRILHENRKKHILIEHACITTWTDLANQIQALPQVHVPITNSANFRRLVLGCMDSYDSDQRLILQGFSRSTRLAFLCTARRSYLVARLLLPSGSHLATDATPSIGRRRVSCFWDTGRFLLLLFFHWDSQTFAPLRYQNFNEKSSVVFGNCS